MDEVEQAARLADRLLEAHRRVRALPLERDARRRLGRRLVAIGDASKHDVARAAARLEVLLAELDADRQTGHP